MARNWRRFIGTLAIVAGAAAVSVPAAAQVYYWSDRPSAPGYDQQPQQRDFFSFPFGGHAIARRSPIIRRRRRRVNWRRPNLTIIVVGDSMADWLGYGLDETYADQPDTGVVREVRATAGLIRYDPKNETLDWPAVIKDQLATEKPNAIIVMLGSTTHPYPRRAAGKGAEPPARTGRGGRSRGGAARRRGSTEHPVPGHSYDFHTDQWAELYVKRIDAMIAALKSKGVPVLWVGLPALRGPKSTSDMAYLDGLYRERAERAEISTSTSGTASPTTRAAMRWTVLISRARSGGCAPPTVCISPKPAR